MTSQQRSNNKSNRVRIHSYWDCDCGYCHLSSSLTLLFGQAQALLSIISMYSEATAKTAKHVRAPVNAGSSDTINMVIKETEEKMSQRGKKRSRHGEGNDMEIMRVVKHISMIISFSLVHA